MLGKSNEPLIIVDTDAVIAFVSINDANHKRAKAMMQQVAALHSYLLFPASVICEAATTLRGKLNNPEDANRIIQKFQTGDFPVQAVDHDILDRATTLYNPFASKKHTLFDAVIAAIAKRLNADAIFSFDEWYKKVGLTLVQDLIATQEQAT